MFAGITQSYPIRHAKATKICYHMCMNMHGSRREMRYDLVIFDLDGTLLDTLDDLAAAANHALSTRGFPTHSRDDVRRFIGNGVARLIRRAAPQDTPDAVCDAMLVDFKRYYARNLSVHTRPFEGVRPLLRALKEKGVLVAVNSNKPDDAVQSLCREHLDGLYAMALGERAGVPKKPAPDGVDRIIDALGVARARTLYVGDSDTDLLTAQNAGVDCAWVSWGYRRRDELGGIETPNAFDTVQALRAFILA